LVPHRHKLTLLVDVDYHKSRQRPTVLESSEFRVADPDPAIFLIADSDPVLDPGFDDNKLKQNLKLKIFKYFLIKNCNLLIPGLYKGRPSTGKAFCPQKRTSSNSKH
jgi:hypothetical protein